MRRVRWFSAAHALIECRSMNEKLNSQAKKTSSRPSVPPSPRVTCCVTFTNSPCLSLCDLGSVPSSRLLSYFLKFLQNRLLWSWRQNLASRQPGSYRFVTRMETFTYISLPWYQKSPSPGASFLCLQRIGSEEEYGWCYSCYYNLILLERWRRRYKPFGV